METVSYHAQDSLYALLVTYLLLGSRDILSSFSVNWQKSDRQVTVDDVVFPIVQRQVGEAHEVPGINLVFYDELQLTKTDRPLNSKLAVVHIYCKTDRNVMAAQRSVLKLQHLINSATYPGGVEVVDFVSDPPQLVSNCCLSWSSLSVPEGWIELTDLSVTEYIHRSKNLQLVYADVAFT